VRKNKQILKSWVCGLQNGLICGLQRRHNIIQNTY